MAIKKNSNQGNLYAPLAKKRPASHKKVVGEGTVGVKKTQRMNNPEETEGAVIPRNKDDGEWVPSGHGDNSWTYMGNAMTKTGRIKRGKKKGFQGGGSSAAGGFGHR